MGYRRSFSETISVHYSGSVSFPASQSGGSVSYSGTAYETVHVNIYVDSDPFERSVSDCKSELTGLNASVATMSAAQVAAIRKNAEQIGSTIVKGFFSTVSSEISQQIAELRSSVDATLLRLNELSKQCADRQRQMQADYTRITSRYMKIFSELDNECKNRIFELDRPAFMFKQTTDHSAARATGNDLVSTAAVAGGENSALEARIVASNAKHSAMEALGHANRFLGLQRRTDNIIAESAIAESEAGTYYSPVCYIETKEGKNIDRKSYSVDKLRLNNSMLVGELRDLDLGNSQENQMQLQSDFEQVVGTHYANANDHDARVRDYVTKLFKSNIINK